MKDKSEEALAKLVAFIEARLIGGKNKEEVVKELNEKFGLEKDFATKLVEEVIEIRATKVESVKSGGGTGGLFAGILSLVGVFVVLNGVLYFGQELYYWNDVKKCETMELRINEFKNEASEIEKMMKNGEIYLQADKIKRYDFIIAEHNELVREYNELAKSAYSRWWLLPIPLPKRH